MDNNISLTDLAAVSYSNGWNRAGEGYATMAGQNEILSCQKYEALDNKIDRGIATITNGLSSVGYENAQLINNAQNSIGGAITTEGRAIADKFCNLRAEMHAEGEATRNLILQNRIDDLKGQVSKLEMQNMLCGIPRINQNPFEVYYPHHCHWRGFGETEAK